jgi:hypothetical protein
MTRPDPVRVLTMLGGLFRAFVIADPEPPARQKLVVGVADPEPSAGFLHRATGPTLLAAQRVTVRAGKSVWRSVFHPLNLHEIGGAIHWPRLFAALSTIAVCGAFWWLVIGSFR